MSMRKIKLGGKSPPQENPNVAKRDFRKIKHSEQRAYHHQRVGSLLSRPLLQIPADEGLQALGHRRGAALHPSPRSLCHGTDVGREGVTKHSYRMMSPCGGLHSLSMSLLTTAFARRYISRSSSSLTGLAVFNLSISRLANAVICC